MSPAMLCLFALKGGSSSVYFKRNIESLGMINTSLPQTRKLSKFVVVQGGSVYPCRLTPHGSGTSRTCPFKTLCQGNRERHGQFLATDPQAKKNYVHQPCVMSAWWLKGNQKKAANFPGSQLHICFLLMDKDAFFKVRGLSLGKEKELSKWEGQWGQAPRFRNRTYPKHLIPVSQSLIFIPQLKLGRPKSLWFPHSIQNASNPFSELPTPRRSQTCRRQIWGSQVSQRKICLI